MPDASEQDFRDDAEQGRAAAEQPVGDNEHGHDIDDLNEQAELALTDRAHRLADHFIHGARTRLMAEMDGDEELEDDDRKDRLRAFERRCEDLKHEFVDKASKVYDDAINRRGRRQAAMDQLQGAIGLPLDPVARQTEIERREAEAAPAPQAMPASAPQVMTSSVHSRLLALDDDDLPQPAAEPVKANDQNDRPRQQRSIADPRMPPGPFEASGQRQDGLTEEQRRRRDALVSG